METIKTYLENMFRNLPKTNEIKRLKNELLSNMEDRYNELKSEGKRENEAVGVVISEFGNIDELMKEMNIKTTADSGKSYPSISIEDAREFIAMNKKASHIIATGVGLILLGVSLMIFLFTFIDGNQIYNSISPDAVNAIPIIILFLFVAVAVGLFIYSVSKMEKYKFIDEGQFELSGKDKSTLSAEFPGIKSNHTTSLLIGVVLCILSPVAIFIGSLLGENATVSGVCIMFVIIAAAVYLLITGSNAAESYKKLLKTDDFDPVVKEQNKAVGAIAGIFWPIVVCIFLYSGIVMNLWHINWIVFPIAGILFGGFTAFYKTMKKT